MNSIEGTKPESPRRLQKTISASITFGTSVLVACAVMMWSVFNAWTNVLTFWTSPQENQAWWIAAMMVLLTCIVPFGLGVWLLFRTIGRYKP
jgi:hypothetical protein